MAAMSSGECVGEASDAFILQLEIDAILVLPDEDEEDDVEENQNTVIYNCLKDVSQLETAFWNQPFIHIKKVTEDLKILCTVQTQDEFSHILEAVEDETIENILTQFVQSAGAEKNLKLAPGVHLKLDLKSVDKKIKKKARIHFKQTTKASRQAVEVEVPALLTPDKEKQREDNKTDLDQVKSNEEGKEELQTVFPQHDEGFSFENDSLSEQTATKEEDSTIASSRTSTEGQVSSENISFSLFESSGKGSGLDDIQTGSINSLYGDQDVEDYVHEQEEHDDDTRSVESWMLFPIHSATFQKPKAVIAPSQLPAEVQIEPKCDPPIPEGSLKDAHNLLEASHVSEDEDISPKNQGEPESDQHMQEDNVKNAAGPFPSGGSEGLQDKLIHDAHTLSGASHVNDDECTQDDTSSEQYGEPENDQQTSESTDDSTQAPSDICKESVPRSAEPTSKMQDEVEFMSNTKDEEEGYTDADTLKESETVGHSDNLFDLPQPFSGESSGDTHKGPKESGEEYLIIYSRGSVATPVSSSKYEKHLSQEAHASDLETAQAQPGTGLRKMVQSISSETLAREIHADFVDHIIPTQVIPYLPSSCINGHEESELAAMERTEGEHKAARRMLEIIKRKQDWFEHLLKALRNENLMASHVADQFKKTKDNLMQHPVEKRKEAISSEEFYDALSEPPQQTITGSQNMKTPSSAFHQVTPYTSEPTGMPVEFLQFPSCATSSVPEMMVYCYTTENLDQQSQNQSSSMQPSSSELRRCVLDQALHQKWNRLPQRQIQRRVQTMWRWVEGVIQAGGGYTRY